MTSELPETDEAKPRSPANVLAAPPERQDFEQARFRRREKSGTRREAKQTRVMPIRQAHGGTK